MIFNFPHRIAFSAIVKDVFSVGINSSLCTLIFVFNEPPHSNEKEYVGQVIKIGNVITLNSGILGRELLISVDDKKICLYLLSDLSSGVTAQVQFVDCGASEVFASLDEMAQITFD